MVPADGSDQSVTRLGENVEMDDPEFRRDLYRGAARHYDRFRVPYPQDLIKDLLARADVGAEDRVLDLACGTGQISFALHGYVNDVLAVDQEDDMIGVGREKAETLAAHNIRFAISTAENLVAPDESFDLIAIGNAFQRLRREKVATMPFVGCDRADVSRCCGASPLGAARHPGSGQCRPPSSAG